MVTLDGEFLFAYDLPSRQAGSVQLLAYDATADFYGIEVRHLPAETILEKASDKTKPIVASRSGGAPLAGRGRSRLSPELGSRKGSEGTYQK